MRAIRFVDGEVDLQEVPSPSGDGARVQVRSIGICGSEVHMLEKRFPIPVIAGHEFAGELEDGRAVGVEPLDPCGECEQCATGNYNICKLGPEIVLGVGRDGGMAAALLAGNPEIARSLISHRFPLEEAAKAFEVARDRKAGAIKVVLEP